MTVDRTALVKIAQLAASLPQPCAVTVQFDEATSDVLAWMVLNGSERKVIPASFGNVQDACEWQIGNVTVIARRVRKPEAGEKRVGLAVVR